jgi:Fe-S-cluster containining protein
MAKKKPAIPRSECDSEKCQRACRNYPGEFRPGEAERVAEFLGMSLQDLFNQYLGVNWWEGYGGENVFMLAPVSHAMTAGQEWPSTPRRGACVFLKSGRCSIHPVKPYACAHGNPCQNKSITKWEHDREFNTVPLWAKKDNQLQIVKLLGRVPHAEPYDHISAIFGGL